MNLFERVERARQRLFEAKREGGDRETDVNPLLTQPKGALIAPVAYEILIDWQAAYVPATKKKAPTKSIT